MAEAAVSSRGSFLARQVLRMAVYGPSYPGRKLLSTPAHWLARWRGAEVVEVTLGDGVRTQVMRVPAVAGTVRRPPVVVLHGWMELKEMHLPHARAMAKQGHDVLLIDQRGHGRSTRAASTIGSVEVGDVPMALAEAERRGWLGDRYCLWGFSMGAAVAIRHAVTDPRVAAVVAIAPYSDLAMAIETFRRRMPAISAEGARQAFDRVAEEVGFDIESASPAAVIGELCAPLLMIEGGLDSALPAAEHSQKLVSLKKYGPVETLRVPWANHFMICRRVWPSVDRKVAEFLGRYTSPTSGG
ncbi:MAG: alpha/beta fold hydrolase [Phycisphaeraceae bacterium]